VVPSQDIIGYTSTNKYRRNKMAGPLIAAPLILRGIAMAAGKAAQLSSKKGGPALRKEFSALLNKAQNKGATTADLSSKAKKFLEAEKIPHFCLLYTSDAADE
jgi:hypothetical protein